jgi:Heparinase II/III-like protein/Heparinase II/III N-terminus
MRSFRELTFRFRQEAANALLSRSSLNPKLQASSPLGILPAPDVVRAGMQDDEYIRRLTQLADEILQGRIPILGAIIDYGADVSWRRDPQRGVETPARYFRGIPYLDVTAAGDHKLIWEVNRHQHLVLLAQAYVLTGREEYSEQVFRQIEHWWTENPFQRGINWTSALEVAFRALSWLWIWHLLGAKMPPAFHRRFLAELYRHGLHLEYNLSIYFSPNTHLLGEAVALHALGRLFPAFPRAERWRAVGHDVVRGHMETCVQKDGSYFEQSTYYHVYALDMFVFHAVLEEVPESYRAGLSRMAEFLASIVSDSGDLPFLGDDDGGRFFSPYGPRSRFARATLATASLLVGNRFFTYNQLDIDEIALWWLGPERCKNRIVQMPNRGSQAFQDTGIVFIRRSPIRALFDAGPFGPGSGGHSHSDSLSLIVTIGDREVLIDPGTYSYMDREWRRYFRESSAHNTVRIDGHDQAVAAGPFRWTAKPEVRLLAFNSDADQDHAVASCSYQGFTHTRTVDFTNSQLAVIDEIDGPSGEHDIEQFWHFAQNPSELGSGRWTIDGLAEFTADGGVVEDAWRSGCFGSKEPAWVVAVRRRASLPVTMTARLKLKS